MSQNGRCHPRALPLSSDGRSPAGGCFQPAQRPGLEPPLPATPTSNRGTVRLESGRPSRLKAIWSPGRYQSLPAQGLRAEVASSLLSPGHRWAAAWRGTEEQSTPTRPAPGRPGRRAPPLTCGRCGGGAEQLHLAPSSSPPALHGADCPARPGPALPRRPRRLAASRPPGPLPVRCGRRSRDTRRPRAAPGGLTWGTAGSGRSSGVRGESAGRVSERLQQPRAPLRPGSEGRRAPGPPPAPL